MADVSTASAVGSTRLTALDTLGLVPVQPEDAQPGVDAPAAWRCNLQVWMWLASMDGVLGAGGLTTDVSASFGDIIKGSDSVFGFAGRLEFGVGPWGGFIDGMYTELGVDDQSGPGGVSDIDVTVHMALLDLGLMYRIGDWEPEGDAAKNPLNVTLDLYAGARYTNLDVVLDPAMAASRSQGVNWFDPIIGARLVLPFDEQWHFGINGDVGGFGAGSQFTWSATATFGYDFRISTHPASVYAGYRALGQDYTKGSGDDEFTWDIVQHGPILGFSLYF